jgi:chemotaxis protein MotB
VNYAAARHLVPSPGPTAGGQGILLPWEAEADVASARQETWLLSFVDILALLLTLFVLLLAYQDREPSPVNANSSVSPIDWSLGPGRPAAGPVLPTVAEDAVGFALPGEGLLPLIVERAAVAPPSKDRTAAGAVPVAAEPSAAGDNTMAATVLQAPAEEPAGDTDAPAVAVIADTNHARPVEPLPRALELPPIGPKTAGDLLETFRDSALGERVEVTARPGAVSLEISDSILFTPASAALSVEGMALLNQLAGVLRTLPYTLAVEGHTDNVPIHTVQYPSNWELSAARAAMVTRKLIEQGVAAQRVRAVGYGDTRPRSENLTPEGRAKNRRVTFVLQVESPAG